MNAVDLLKRLHQHRAWVNGNLLAAAAQLSQEQLRIAVSNRPGVYLEFARSPSCRRICLAGGAPGRRNPLLPGDVAGKIPGNQEGKGGIMELAELREKWATLEQRWGDYLASLTPASLDDLVYKKISATGQRFGTRRADVLLHVCTHAHYTAAQVVNMLRQAGDDKLPQTMMISLARHEGRENENSFSPRLAVGSGGVKPTFLAQHGHEVINPKLPDEDFNEAVRIAQDEFDKHQPQVVVGSSTGRRRRDEHRQRRARLVLLCPAWKKWGTVKTVKPGTVILHSRADDVVPFADSEELAKQRAESTLIEVGTDHRLADPEPLAAMLKACERRE